MSFNILLFGNNTTLARSLQAYSSKTHSGLQVFPATSHTKVLELMSKTRFQVVLVEESLDQSLPENWIQLIQNKGHNTSPTIHFMAVSGDTETETLRKLLTRGFTDAVSSPVDVAILLQKIHMLFPDSPLLKENLLFSLDVTEECELNIQGKIIRASEYGAVIRTDREFPVGQVLAINSTMASGTADFTTLLARVVSLTKESPVAGGATSYKISVLFLGSSKRELTNLRVWLHRHYVVAAHPSEEGVN